MGKFRLWRRVAKTGLMKGRPWQCWTDLRVGGTEVSTGTRRMEPEFYKFKSPDFIALRTLSGAVGRITDQTPVAIIQDLWSA